MSSFEKAKKIYTDAVIITSDDIKKLIKQLDGVEKHGLVYLCAFLIAKEKQPILYRIIGA